MTKSEVIKSVLLKNKNMSNSELANILYETHISLFKNWKKRNLVDEIQKTRRKNKLFRDPEFNDESEKVYSFTDNGASATVEKITSERVKTMDDLIRICEIDTDVWEIYKSEVSAYESHTKLRRYDEENVRINDLHKLVPLFRVKVFLRRNTFNETVKNLKEELLNELKSHAIEYKKLTYPKLNKKLRNVLLEINIFDLHFGKHAWEDETGENYDIKIAKEKYLKCINELLSLATVNYNIDRFLIPIGNDFFNSDNSFNTTTNNTPQNEDTRWQKTFSRGRQLIITAIDMISLIAPVTVLMVPGNHDFERTFYLGEVLEAWYSKNPNVQVDNGPKIRKYFQYGKNLIGFTHGKDEKITDLPMLMATEVPELWAKTKYREIHLGHFHIKREIKWLSTEEYKGVVVRFMRSLTATDSWHFKKGFVGNIQSGEAFIWDYEQGLIGQFSSNM